MKIIFYLIFLISLFLFIIVDYLGYPYLKVVITTNNTNERKTELSKLIQNKNIEDGVIASIIKYEDDDLIFEIINSKPLSADLLNELIKKKNINFIKEVLKKYPNNIEFINEIINNGTYEMLIYIASMKDLTKNSVLLLLKKIDEKKINNKELFGVLKENRLIFPMILEVEENEKYEELFSSPYIKYVIKLVKEHNKNLLEILKGDHLDRIMALYYKEKLDLIDLYFLEKVKINFDEEKIKDVYQNHLFFTDVNKRILDIKIRERENQDIKLNHEIIKTLSKQEFKKIYPQDIKKIKEHIKSIETEVKESLPKPEFIGKTFTPTMLLYNVGKGIYNIHEINSQGAEIFTKVANKRVKDLVKLSIEKRLKNIKNEEKVQFELLNKKYENNNIDFLSK